ncbi:phosphatidylserine decarboxylase family protein [Halosquirtibacter laminarini]|uniref:Phosphatidylserine decarboxylase family protein n=1 Tax=Halosquirtibacter laminarini TaxID=3374600 RepID=A0AC61NN61_9BACT|nr:phosphatidylserine decarboxylase family protein [Prolixibacteraceae bacterium]
MTTIHKEGFGIIAFFLIVLAGLDTLVWFSGERIFFWVMLCLTIPFFTLVVRFFRYPKRVAKVDDSLVISPADGQIVAIEEVYEPEFFEDKRIMVSVFMTVFNVHINWIPVKGVVKFFRHHKGRFLSAYLPKSSTDNERTTMVVELENKQEVLFRQIAGAVAKRIISYPKEGDVVDQNTQLGFIRFGSRVDVYLPLGTDINVEMGEIVKGTETVLAKVQ